MPARPFHFRSDDLLLEGEVVAGERPRLLLVLCHGIPSGRPPDPADEGYAGLARRLASLGHAAVWFDMRGARASPGEFSIGGWARDVDSALDALDGRPEAGALPRILIGSSAGGAVAVAVGARRADVVAVATLAAPASFTFGSLVEDPARLVAEFRNVGIIRDPAYPGDLHAWWLEFGELAAEDHVAKVAPRPLLLVHGDADEVVPYPHAERLFAAASEPKELVRLPGGGHHLRRDPRAIEALVDWLDNLPA